MGIRIWSSAGLNPVAQGIHDSRAHRGENNGGPRITFIRKKDGKKLKFARIDADIRFVSINDRDAMDAITVTFDLRLYPPMAVVKAAHCFSATHSATIDHADHTATVTLTPRTNDAPDVLDALHDAVIDEALRESVHDRTRAIHESLVAAAFAPVSGP
jgi:His-Xaa-Ser system protein HxsD